MNSEDIKIIFSDYLKTKETQYAVLLNGTWGSGKTFFWKYHLSKIAEDNKFKVVYLSLNGISKIENLEHLLFIKLLPFIGKQEDTRTKNLITLLTNVLNQVSKHYLKTSLTDIFKDVSIDSLDFSSYVICFDDLERCQMPVKEVLGFINNYVEHKKLKTIILADENNIDVSQKGYDNIKEKVIGRVLNFELNIREILPQLFKKYDKDKNGFYNFLIIHEPTLIDILTEYKQDNLRVISFYLDILERIFPVFKNVEEKYIQEIILFTAIISFEFKKGNLNSSDYKNPNGIDEINEHYYSLNIAQTIRESSSGKDKVKTYAQGFYETYLENRIKNYFYYPSIYSFILSGYIKLSDLNAEINKRYPEIISQEIQDFRTLLNYKFRELSDDDFKKLTWSVLNFAKEGKYTIYDYVQIANFFYFFSENNLIVESNEEINKLLLEGLDIAKSRKEINDKVLDNLLHFGDDNPEVTRIKAIVENIHLEIKKGQYIDDSNKLINSIIKNDEFALESIFEKQKYSKELFQYVNSKLLFEAITQTSNKQIFNFTELLNSRYKSKNIGEYLFEDFESLFMLKENLNNFINNNGILQQPRKFLLKTLFETLQKICLHLKETKNK
ncbi:P-loop NTPase fold protein [Arcicella rosea]|nr:P-loop NTPase fold protein [Arcicella rosea]